MEQVDFGNLAVQYAKKALNMKVIAVDINDDKLNLAKEVGADYIINSLNEDPTKKIMELTNGGAHGAVVSAVAKIAFDQAVYSIRAGGRVVAVGLPSEMMDIPIIKTVIDGIEVVGSIVGTRKDLEEAFDFGARGVVVPVVQTRPIEDAIKIFEEILELPEGYDSKVVIILGEAKDIVKLLDSKDEEDTKYFVENGIHYVPKLKLGDFILGKK